jgi:hypothetical protein
MYEPKDQNSMSKTQWKAPHYGVGASLLVVGLLAGRAFFPLEIPRPFIVEKEKRIEVPVERVIEQRVPYEVIKYVDRVVEKRVEVPVEKIVEKRVEVPVDRIVYRDRIVEKSVSAAPAGLSSWRRITKGLSRDQVRAILGEPRKVEGGDFEKWYYGRDIYYGASASVIFYSNAVDSWSEP